MNVHAQVYNPIRLILSAIGINPTTTQVKQACMGPTMSFEDVKTAVIAAIAAHQVGTAKREGIATAGHEEQIQG